MSENDGVIRQYITAEEEDEMFPRQFFTKEELEADRTPKDEIITSTIKIPRQVWSDFGILITRQNGSRKKGEKRKNKSLVITGMLREYVEKHKRYLDRL